MRFKRSSGVLCHLTSLPNEYGIGDLGAASFSFIDFLQAAGQSLWQILPLSPPAQGNSPYSAYSAIAGNPLLLDLRELVVNGWLVESDLVMPSDQDSSAQFVDFEAVKAFKIPLLRIAFERFKVDGRNDVMQQYQAFCESESEWLDDFALFEVLMDHFDESDWSLWPFDLVTREESAISFWKEKLSEQIAFSKFLQWLFASQWKAVKKYANERGVKMYGDMPIFVAYESADVWANQAIFAVDSKGKRTFVAGVPPDYFSKTGQLWGNPLYNWEVIEETGYHWWNQRFAHALEQFDILRIDHFRGFEAYWEVPATAKTAIKGQWKKGPGEKPFNAANAKLGELPFIAEDLGMITDEVHRLRDHLGFPGMRVMHFGFDHVEDDFHRPSAFPEHSVAYTGTHDNETTMGWYRSRRIAEGKVDPLDQVIKSDQDIHFQLIEEVMRSASEVAVVPVQDLLGLGNEARMNRPGQANGNWGWRLEPGQLDSQLAIRLKELTRKHSR